MIPLKVTSFFKLLNSTSLKSLLFIDLELNKQGDEKSFSIYLTKFLQVTLYQEIQK